MNVLLISFIYHLILSSQHFTAFVTLYHKLVMSIFLAIVINTLYGSNL